MTNSTPDDERHGGELGRQVRKGWFDELDSDKQDEIILPAFEAEHPTNADKKEAVKKHRT